MNKPVLCLVILTICLGRPTWADDTQDRALAAVAAGEIQPLDAIEALVAEQMTGEVIDVELDQNDSKWIYELKVRDTQGKLVELDVDAKTGEILKIDAGDD